jgi:DNA-binding beta-propeller fold protein YncE
MAVVLIGLSLVLAGGATCSAADSPAELWTKCLSGSGAGQCTSPRGVAVNRANGHIFVADLDADQVSGRVNEFNALGQFIETWGWDVVQSGPGNNGTAFEICLPEEGDVCQAGTGGSGAGQFSAPLGVAVDSAGSVYVVDFLNHRVEKFDRKGHFMLMFGDGVDQGPNHPGDVCTAQYIEEGDSCGAGIEGAAGNGQFSWPEPGSFLAITPADKVYVGDENRIQRFDTGGGFQGECAVGGTVQSLATDPAGNLYAGFLGSANVHKLGPACEALSPTFKVEIAGKQFKPNAVAVDAAGNVYAFGPTNFDSFPRDPIFEFDPAGNLIANFGKGEFSGSTGLATNLCTGSDPPGNLYVTNASASEAFLRSYGTDPIGCFKARTLPASNIGEHSATLNGTVNPTGLAVSECLFEYGSSTAYEHGAPCVPGAGEIGTGTSPVGVKGDLGGLEKGTVQHFRLVARVGGELEVGADVEFKTLGPPVISDEHVVEAAFSEASLAALVNPEGFPTTYRFQYTTEAAFQEHGFEGALSTAAVEVGEDRTAHPVGADLKGLIPGGAYRWRVVAANSSGESEGEVLAFVTYRPPVGGGDSCANKTFRTGTSAFLPDCRAYEMVSPVDKNGGNVVRGLNGVADPGGYVQSAPDGESLTYTATTAFADPPNSYLFNQYLTRRGPGSWATQGINLPVRGQKSDPGIDPGILRAFGAFTPDLCQAWVIDHQTPPLSADGQEGFPNLYRRENCGAGAGGLEAMAPAPPPLPGGTKENYVDRNSVQGISADGRHALFIARTKLSEEAHGGESFQIYDRFGGGNHLVSILPDGTASLENAEVGSGIQGNLQGAVSADGSVAYWSLGEVFVRTHPEQGKVAGECTEPAVACTRAVSASSAFFWGGATDGSRALYSEGGLEGGQAELFEFDLGKAEEGEEVRRPIANHVIGVAGQSEDLGRVYFVSTDALSDEEEGEANSEGDFAEAGQPNLYLEEGGAIAFIGTLVAGDVGAKEPGFAPAYGIAAKLPYFRAARVSPDGERIVFDSRAGLTGFDSRGADGRAAVEVFSYAAGTGKLICVSCNPGGARPARRELREPYAGLKGGLDTEVQAAAWIPTWEHPLHASNVLSSDGKRIFFNSNDALVPRDTNGAQDVYQWEMAGAGGCRESAPDYFPQNGGCLDLISSGESPSESEFWEASPDGRNVFFTTESSLLPQDPGLIDLYDAREGGGFPQPVVEAECEGEACQSPPPPPGFATPASSSYSGPPNPPHKQKKHHRHHHKHKHRANTGRRAGR